MTKTTRHMIRSTMRTRPAPSRALAAMGLALFLGAGTAGAQAPATPAPAQDGATAVKHAQAGRAAYDASRWDEAYDLFAKAHAAAASPVFELYMARARRQAGKLVEARAIYRRVSQRPVADTDPASWRQAGLDASAELGVLVAQIPSLVVDASRTGPSTRVRVDARPVRPGETVDVDPGEHVVAWSGAGGSSDTGEKRVSVSVGQRGVVVALTTGVATAPPASAGPAPSSPEDDARGEGSLVPGVVGLSLGAATLGVGAILGVLALGADSDAATTCPGGRCETSADLTSAEADRDSAGGLADVSTVMFVAGSVLTAAGVVLLVVRPGGGDSDVTVGVGPRGVSLAGRL